MVRRVLDHWFGPPDGPCHCEPRGFWFTSTPALDDELRRRFGADIAAAMRGRLRALERTPRGALALCLLLDQMTRNTARGSAAAFAGDAAARVIARRAVARGFDRRLKPIQRVFLYLPYEHSESRGDQGRCVGLMGAIRPPRKLFYAVAHRELIAKFGRFPHRNAALGRDDTEAERAYLAGEHQRFGQ